MGVQCAVQLATTFYNHACLSIDSKCVEQVDSSQLNFYVYMKYWTENIYNFSTRTCQPGGTFVTEMSFALDRDRRS